MVAGRGAGRRGSHLFLVWLLLATFAVNSLFADSPTVEMTAEHSIIPGSPFVIAYITLHNKTSKPVEVLTCLPNTGGASRGGAWMFSLQSSVYAEESGDHIPIKARLLPLTIPPDGRVTFSERIPFGFNPPIDSKTSVGFQYKVLERDAKRYGVWGGVLIASSTFVPFYETK